MATSAPTTPAPPPNPLQPVESIDIQFDPTYNQYKAQQLAQALQTATGVVNTLLQRLAALQGTVVKNAAAPQPVLATEQGLGPQQTVSGLTTGDVFTATAPNSAAFVPLSLINLTDVDPSTFATAKEGQVLTWLNGYVGLANAPGGAESLRQTFLTLNPEQATLANSFELVAGQNITFTRDPTTKLIISSAGATGLNEIDGGDAKSTYTLQQDLTGGNANPAGFIGPPIDGGGA